MSREFSLPYRPLRHRNLAHALASFKIPYIGELENWRFPNQSNRGDRWRVTDFLPHQINDQTSGDGRFINAQEPMRGGDSKGKKKSKQVKSKKEIKGAVSAKNKAVAIAIKVGHDYSNNGHNPPLSNTNARTQYPYMSSQPSYASRPFPFPTNATAYHQSLPSPAELSQILTQASQSAESLRSTSRPLSTVPSNRLPPTGSTVRTTPNSGQSRGTSTLTQPGARPFQRRNRQPESDSNSSPYNEAVDGPSLTRPTPNTVNTTSTYNPGRTVAGLPSPARVTFAHLHRPVGSETGRPRVPSSVDIHARRVVEPSGWVSDTGTGRRRPLRRKGGMSQVALARVSNPPYRQPRPTPRPGYAFPVFKGKGKKNWIQEVVEAPTFRRGALTRKAYRAGFPTATALAQQVKKHPQDYSLRTRRQANFALNVQKRKGGALSSLPPRKLIGLRPVSVNPVQLSNAEIRDRIVLNSRQNDLPRPDREMQSVLTTKPDSGASRRRRKIRK